MPRPLPSYHGFYGQRLAVPYVSRRVAGARKSYRACCSFLLTAPSGMGKTRLARAIHKDYGDTAFVEVIANKALTPSKLEKILGQLDFGDFLFIDEGHALSPDCQELLYGALDEQKIHSRLQPGRVVSVAEFTLIAATDKPGMLRRAFLNRLAEVFLSAYSIAELKKIAEVIAEDAGHEITPQAARRIAECSQGTPRGVKKLMHTLRDLHADSPGGRWSQPHVEDVIEAEGFDDHGLTRMQQDYLLILLETPRGACSLDVLAISLGDRTFLRREIEPHLILLGLVDPRTTHGRGLTERGRRVATEIRRNRTEADPNEE